MNLRRYWILTLVTLVASSGVRVSADHIPGHQNDDPVFPVPFPGQADWNGGGTIVFLVLIGPDGGTTIYTTTLDITYVSDGVTPAANLVIVASLFVDGQQRELDITGADLGFGVGPGTYKATFETDIFNGVVDAGIPGPFSVVHLDIGSTTGPVNGSAFFVDSFINFTVQEPINVPAVSQWGIGLMILLLLCAGTIVFRRRLSTEAN